MNMIAVFSWGGPRCRHATALFVVFVTLALPVAARSDAFVSVGQAPNAAVCDSAADDAERGFGLPAGLLRAIGIVESGRWQPLLGRAAPWPYAIDAGGYSLFMEGLADAVGKVAALRQQGFESIDVGCFQINLLYHPGAFASVEQAFDPAANAAYAARFLLELYARSGTWDAAVAAYHSSVASVGEPYRARVYAVWQGAPAGEITRTRLVSVTLGPPPMAIPGQATTAGRAGWGARTLPIPHMGIRVFVPTDLMAVEMPRGEAGPVQIRPLQVAWSPKRRLPLVFTPGSHSP